MNLRTYLKTNMQHFFIEDLNAFLTGLKQATGLNISWAQTTSRKAFLLKGNGKEVKVGWPSRPGGDYGGGRFSETPENLTVAFIRLFGTDEAVTEAVDKCTRLKAKGFRSTSALKLVPELSGPTAASEPDDEDSEG